MEPVVERLPSMGKTLVPSSTQEDKGRVGPTGRVGQRAGRRNPVGKGVCGPSLSAFRKWWLSS